MGGPTNHLLADGGLSTVIAGASNKTNNALTSSLQRLQSRSGGGADRTLQSAFRAIGQMCEKLGLVRIIKDRACELYKQVHERGPLLGALEPLSPCGPGWPCFSCIRGSVPSVGPVGLNCCLRMVELGFQMCALFDDADCWCCSA